MKKTVLFAWMLFLFISCNDAGHTATVDTGKPDPAEQKDDLDAAIGFIKAALNGKYDDARTYLLEDSTNTQYCDAMERKYSGLDRNKKEEYKLASIQNMKKEKLNDSVVLVNYSNSYEKQPYQLKLVRVNDRWKVDLKHSFENKRDSIK